MKKTIIAVAAAISLGASLVKAGELKVNFDGAGKGDASLLETIKNGTEGSEISIPGVPARSWPGDVNSQSQITGVFSPAGNTGIMTPGIIIKGISRQEILKEILKQYLSAKSNKDSYPIDLLERSDTQILFAEESVCIRIKGGDTYLYEIKDRALVYTIKVILSDEVVQTKQASLVCKFVKELVKAILWDIILQKWYEAWVETGKLIEVCTAGDPPSEPYICPSPMYGCTITSDCHQLCE